MVPVIAAAVLAAGAGAVLLARFKRRARRVT
jgi:hypothetical protein